MFVRQAQPRDLTTLVEFNRALARETEQMELIPEDVRRGVAAVLSDSEKGFYLVAQEQEHILGSLLVTPEWSDWRNGNFWWIQSVYVIPEYRRRGVFRALLAHVQELAHRSPYSVCGLRLYVTQTNQTGMETYIQLGFQPTHYRMLERPLFRPNAR